MFALQKIGAKTLECCRYRRVCNEVLCFDIKRPRVNLFAVCLHSLEMRSSTSITCAAPHTWQCNRRNELGFIHKYDFQLGTIARGGREGEPAGRRVGGDGRLCSPPRARMLHYYIFKRLVVPPLGSVSLGKVSFLYHCWLP